MNKRVKQVLIVLAAAQMLLVNVFAGSRYYFSIDTNKTKQENLENAKEENQLKTRVAEYGRFTMYYFLDNEDKKAFKPQVDAFKSVGKTDYEKLLEIVKYFRTLGLKYGPRNDAGVVNQIKNIPNGYTMCAGAALFSGELLNKTGLEYRYVLRRYRDRGDLTALATDGGHIYLEVKTDKGNWMEFDPTAIISYGRNWNYNNVLSKNIKAANSRGFAEMPDRNYKQNIVKKKNNEYREYIVSPVYKNGEKIDSKLHIFNDL